MVVCVGHSHVQFRLEFDGVQVVNPGSVGQPRDGDPRCAYAVIEDGKVHLRRVEYDIDATVAHLRGSGIDPEAVDLAESALRSGGRLPIKWAKNGDSPRGDREV
jgi:diadenosine tetraphosphatase ApaH/serine/threonine PP2A family protein phosphatase